MVNSVINNKKLLSIANISILIIITLIRFYLTGDRDIIALNSPHDDYWYINDAYNFFSRSDYNSMVNIHTPVYSMWIVLNKFLGIPLRLGIDLFEVISFYYISRQFYILTRSIFLAEILYIFLIFHPYFFVVNDRALSETLLVPLFAVMLGSGIALFKIINDDEGPLFTTSLVFSLSTALTYYVRSEGIFIAPFFLLVIFFSYFAKIHINNTKIIFRNFILYPIFLTMMIGFLISSANYIRYGAFEINSLHNSSYKSALKLLNSINGGDTPLQVSITKSMLKEAYEVSPTMSELKPFFEGPIGKMWVDISANFVNAPGEIGSGWFYWAFRDAAQGAGWYKNPSITAAKYKAVSNELEDAFKANKLLKRKLVLSSFLDPMYSKWVLSLPTSFVQVVKVLIPTLKNGLWPNETATSAQLNVYTKMTARRSSLNKVIVRGWIVAPEGAKIGLGSSNQPSNLLALYGASRPDVKGGIPFLLENEQPGNIDTLYYEDLNKNITKFSLASLREGAVNIFSNQEKTNFGVEGYVNQINKYRLVKIWEFLVDFYKYVSIIIMFIISINIIYIVLNKINSLQSVVFIFFIVLIFSRIFIFTLLDASSWSGAQIRYIMPLIPAFGFIGFLGANMIHTRMVKNKL